jgi:DNA invertase Pin-like site-specific DNA recombinase
LAVNLAYKRVSTQKQDLCRQEEAFKVLQIDRDYCDKLSGSSADRPQLNKLRLEAKEDDNIYVESISRPGRPIGRPPRKVPASFKKFYPMLKDRDITATDFAGLIGICRPSLCLKQKLTL